MPRFPTPDHEGFFWAKLVHPSGIPEGYDWQSFDWEVVQVVDNNGEGDEALAVAVGGISPSQWVQDFVWGPEVQRPPELGPPRLPPVSYRRRSKA